jgi:hypothetical protein
MSKLMEVAHEGIVMNHKKLRRLYRKERKLRGFDKESPPR